MMSFAVPYLWFQMKHVYLDVVIFPSSVSTSSCFIFLYQFVGSSRRSYMQCSSSRSYMQCSSSRSYMQCSSSRSYMQCLSSRAYMQCSSSRSYMQCSSSRSYMQCSSSRSYMQCLSFHILPGTKLLFCGWMNTIQYYYNSSPCKYAAVCVLIWYSSSARMLH